MNGGSKIMDTEGAQDIEEWNGITGGKKQGKQSARVKGGDK